MQSHIPPSQALSPRVSILWRVVWQAVILTMFTAVVLATLSFVASRAMLERAVQTQLLSVASIAEDLLEEGLHVDRERASLIAGQSGVRGVLTGTPGTFSAESFLNTLQSDETSLRGITIFTPTGDAVSSAGEKIDLTSKELKAIAPRPIVSDRGWVSYDVIAPVISRDDIVIGYVALRYDTMSLLKPILSVVPTLGESGETFFMLREENSIRVVHPSLEEKDAYSLSIAFSADPASVKIDRIMEGSEGYMRAQDYRGHDGLLAYRYLPTLGWGMILKVDRNFALREVHTLALTHAALGAALLTLAGLLAFLLGRQLTNPLRNLAASVRSLKPGNWSLARSVHSNDEVEVLDAVLVDMAARLKDVYEGQEVVIAERTGELNKQHVMDRALLEHIGYGVVTVDEHGRITNANPAAQEMLAQKIDKLTGKKIEEAMVLCGHRGDVLKTEHPVLQSIKTKKQVRSSPSAHVNMRRIDDTSVPVMYAVNPLIEGSKLFGAIIVFQDMTEERRLDYLKSDFISLASHQLRTPLSALRWYVELFTEKEKDFDEEQRGYLHEMQQALTRMVALLSSLLHAARVEGGDFQLDVQTVDVVQVIGEMEEDCMTMAHESGITCDIKMPSKAMKIESDPTLIRIVMQNLLSNAVKYTPKNAKKRIMVVAAESSDGVEIRVQDEGVGIPKVEQKRMFEKFFRATNVRKIDTDGNGLGLHITRSIIERLGGTITFTSVENEGTVFTVKLPKKMKK